MTPNKAQDAPSLHFSLTIGNHIFFGKFILTKLTYRAVSLSNYKDKKYNRMEFIKQFALRYQETLNGFLLQYHEYKENFCLMVC